MKKYITVLIFLLFAIPLQAETKWLAWLPGIIDPPDYPAPMGFYIYCSNNDTIEKGNPLTYLVKVDVGMAMEIEIDGETYYAVTTTWCGKYRCFAVSAYIIYGIAPYTVKIESDISNIACFDFGVCIDPDSPVIIEFGLHP